MVHINTLMIQAMLAKPHWQASSRMPISRIASVRGSSPVVSRSRRRCASSALPGARLIVRPALGARGLGRLPRLALGLLQRRVQPVDLGEHLVALRCGWRIAVTKRPWFFSLFSRTRELELLRDLDEGGVLIPESRVVAPFPDQDGRHRGGSGRFDLARQAFPALPEGAVIRDPRRGRWAGEEALPAGTSGANQTSTEPSALAWRSWF